MSTLWNPMFNDAIAEMNELFGLRSPRSMARARLPRDGSPWMNPAVDIVEEESAFVLAFDLPGLKTEDVHVEIDDRVLKVHGERTLVQDGAEGYRRVEREHGRFERRFRLPETVDVEALEAKLEAGVLTLRLPKREGPSARRIEIAAA